MASCHSHWEASEKTGLWSLTTWDLSPVPPRISGVTLLSHFSSPHLSFLIYKNNNGCPEIKREVRNLFKKALQGIQFETGKSVIKKQSYGILQEIAQVLIDNPTWSVEIQGHTDNVGNSESNLKLSNDRASSVRDFLINAGVPQERMSAKGYGDTMPVADNSTSKGRAQNRRVEFVVSFEQVTYETLDIQGNVIATDTIQ